MTWERVQNLSKEKDEKKTQLENLLETKSTSLWEQDLEDFLHALEVGVELVVFVLVSFILIKVFVTVHVGGRHGRKSWRTKGRQLSKAEEHPLREKE